MEKLGIYIHVPFCVSKCPYCDFYSVINHEKDKKVRKDFVNALRLEIREIAKDVPPSKVADTIYLGGGTPSLLSGEDIGEIIREVRADFKFETPEITIEVNPKTVDKAKLISFKEAGINRISLGVQSFSDDILKTLGRVHKAKDSEETFKLIREVGFTNVSIDLMFGIPGQTMETWMDTVKKAMELAPEHISLYSLEFMPGTKFDEKLKKGIFEETNSKLDREMYHKALEAFSEAGYFSYEISNISKSGFESKHNMKYWNLEEYMGFGPGASSYIVDYSGKGFRISNKANINEYIEEVTQTGKAPKEIIENSEFDDMSEWTFTGLRRTKGISLGEFKEKFGKEFWEVFKESKEEFLSFEKEGYVVSVNSDRIYLTPKGFDISNKIFCLFV